MKDALGKDLVIGKLYGYSNTQNGITTIKAGVLTTITAERITLDVKYAAKAVYSHDAELEKSWKNTVSVKSNMVFPLESL